MEIMFGVETMYFDRYTKKDINEILKLSNEMSDVPKDFQDISKEFYDKNEFNFFFLHQGLPLIGNVTSGAFTIKELEEFKYYYGGEMSEPFIRVEVRSPDDYYIHIVMTETEYKQKCISKEAFLNSWTKANKKIKDSIQKELEEKEDIDKKISSLKSTIQTVQVNKL